MLIALTDQQYLVPTNGEPLRGLIQDHVVAGVFLTKRDTFLNWEDFQQLIYVACLGECSAIESVSKVQPAILKPVPLWTGKQVITAVIGLIAAGRPPMYMTGKSRLPGSSWGMGRGSTKGCEEDQVIIQEGELVQGVLDKKQFGDASFGLVHSVFELYGPTVAGKLLTVFGRLFTRFLQSHGFTCGIDDLLLSAGAELTRTKLQATLPVNSAAVERDFVELPHTAKTKETRAAMRRKMQEPNWKPKLDGLLRQVRHCLCPTCSTAVLDAQDGAFVLRPCVSAHNVRS